jgi:hypothetical protein
MKQTVRHLIPTLKVVTALGAALTAIFLVLPPQTSITPLPPSLPALASAQPPMPSNNSVYTDSVVQSNMFSLTRRAPASRTFAMSPTDAAAGAFPGDSVSVDAVVGDSLSTERRAMESVPHLYGIVDGPSGRAALLRLDARQTNARLFYLGEGTAGYRVRSIGSDRAELSGPSGGVVLHLPARRGAP